MTLRDLMEGTNIEGDICLSLWNNCNEIALCEIMNVTNALSGHHLKKAKRTVTSYGDNRKIPSVLKWSDYEVVYIFCPNDRFLHIELSFKERD